MRYKDDFTPVSKHIYQTFDLRYTGVLDISKYPDAMVIDLIHFTKPEDVINGKATEVQWVCWNN